MVESPAKLERRQWDVCPGKADPHQGGKTTVGKPGAIRRQYPANSLGEGYEKYRATGAFKAKAPATQDGWERGWREIGPVFGDVDPWTVGLEDLDLWYNGDVAGDIKGLLDTIGVSEAYHVMKTWRALWKVVGTINRPAGGKYFDPKGDPSLGIPSQDAPKPRSVDVARAGEARYRLVKRAWRMGKKGAACILAVGWDSMLSPVDLRRLTPAQLRGDAEGPFFQLDRAKISGKGTAIGTLSRPSLR